MFCYIIIVAGSLVLHMMKTNVFRDVDFYIMSSAINALPYILIGKRTLFFRFALSTNGDFYLLKIVDA